MNKADLTALGLTDEAVQTKVLKAHNKALSKYRSKTQELLPYQEAIHSFHMGYSSDDIPTPENPTQALAQVLQSIQEQAGMAVTELSTNLAVANSLLEKWDVVNTLSPDVKRDLDLATKNFVDLIKQRTTQPEVPIG